MDAPFDPRRVVGGRGGSRNDTAGRWVVRLLGATGLALASWLVVRPHALNWGATPRERARALPGDAIVPNPDAISTMAIDIEAPPQAVWPWLVQLGQARGGFYSFTWAENLVGLAITNADRIHPEWQDLDVGDIVRLGTAERFPDAVLEVTAIEPERSLVLRTPTAPPWWVWAFCIEPVDGQTSRLLVRSRLRLPSNPVIREGVRLVLDPVTAVMTVGMLRGIRARAARLAADDGRDDGEGA